MTNPFQSIINEFSETATTIIFLVLVIFVIATIGVAFGMQELTNQLITSLGLFAIVILAIPPIGLIVAIFVIFKRSLDNSVGI
jgi:hypothetical protein